MRPIKLRTWDNERKVMVYEFDVNFDENPTAYVLLTKDDNSIFCGNYLDNGDWQELEVMQSTCIKNKDGIEEWEGDIYKRILDKKNRFPTKKYQWADYWLIEWLPESACFTTTHIGEEESNGFKRSNNIKRNSFSQRFNEMDVHIGNIYENIELIKWL